MITLQGDKKLIKKLNKLAKKDIQKAIRKGTRAGAKEVATAARSAAPVDSGALKRSIKVRALPRSRVRIGHRVVVGQNFQGDFYGGFIQYGTKHISADPYLTRAVQSSGKKAAEATARTIASEVKKLGN